MEQRSERPLAGRAVALASSRPAPSTVARSELETVLPVTRTLRALRVNTLSGVGDGVGSGGFSVNDAVTERACDTVTWQLPVPEQPAPDHPLNEEPAAGAAVSVTRVPSAKLAEQAAPQEMPPGEELTCPLPLPERSTVSGKDEVVDEIHPSAEETLAYTP